MDNTDLKWLSIRSTVTCSSLALCCGLTAILLFTVGYQAGTKWNEDAIETRCKIIAHNIDQRLCSYQCNCQQSCSGSGSSRSCHTTCQTCYYTCYDGQVRYEYHDYKDKIHRFWDEPYSGERSKEDLKKDLEKNYKMGSKVKCYYQKHDVTDVKLKLVDASGFYISSMVFFGLWAFLGFMYCCSEIVYLVWKNLDSIKSFDIELKTITAKFV